MDLQHQTFPGEELRTLVAPLLSAPGPRGTLEGWHNITEKGAIF